MSPSSAPTIWSDTKDAGRRLLRRGKYLAGYHPLTLPMLVRLTPEGPGRAVHQQTDLVVEGFPRSGTTFAVFALRFANPDLQVASHVHHRSQLVRGTDLGVPTVVVIREPLTCLASYLVAGPHGRPRGVIKEYLSYHRELERLGESVAIVTFTAATTSMGAVIDAINGHFGLALARFSDSAPDTAAVFAQIDEKHQRFGPGRHELGVARPDDRRSREKNRRLQELQAPTLAPALQEASVLFDRLARRSIV